MTNIVGLASFAVLLAVGQVLFKKVALGVRGLPLGDGLSAILRESIFYEALTLYGLSTLLWIWLLSRIPLSQAYPWVAIGSVLVPLSAWFLFNERVAPVFWVGVMLILAGLFLTQYGTRTP